VKDTNSDGTTVEYLNGPGIDNKIRQKGSSTSATYYFSQDHLGSTSALTGTTGKLVERTTYDGYGNGAGSTRTRYGFTGRERDPLTSLHWRRASAGSGDLGGLGIYQHYLQDIFSHRGFEDPLYGHSPVHGGSHADDKTDEDPDKAMEMARATLDALKRFAREKKGKCQCTDDVDWDRVRRFAEAPGGNAFTRRAYDIEHVNPWYLKNKIQILGVPRR